MDAFGAVAAQWSVVANSTRGIAAIASWAQRRPSLGEYRSPADLVATINRPSQPERSCALLADLLTVAQDDPLAQMAVLRALLPGLQRVVRQRWKTAQANGPWPTQTDLAADAISTTWEAIRHHAGRTHTLPARLIIRRVERRLRTIHDAHHRDTSRSITVWDIATTIAPSFEHPTEERGFADALLEAVESGRLDWTSAAVAYRIGILDEPATSAGRQHHLESGQTRQSLRLVLDVLAGATRAPHATDDSRPAIRAPTQEVPLVSFTHPPDHGPAPTPAIMPLLLTVNQAAQMLGIGRSTFYELIDTEEIRSVKVGASRRIPLKAVHEYIDRLLGDDDGAGVANLPNLTVARKS